MVSQDATSASIDSTMCAGRCSGARPLTCCSITAMAPTLTSTPASTEATRERYMSRGSVLMIWPKTTWPICSALMPERAMASREAKVASSIGAKPERLPPKVPIAVRAPERMTIPVMVGLRG